MSVDEPRVRDILRVLCRAAIPRGQLVLYKLAKLSPDVGFKSNEVGKAIHYNSAQFRGQMAALSVRINRTPRETHLTGKPGIGLMFVQTWGGDEYQYKPRPELLAAIERLTTLATYLESSIEEVVAGDSVDEQLPLDVPKQPEKVVDSTHIVEQEGKLVAPFHRLLRKLDDAGLYFRRETVANVLLALQVKRFVILSGISGTGKTRIGQAIAAQFPLTRKVAAPQSLDERVAPVREERIANSEIIPVRPDWTDNRGLLGFYNPLTRQYVTTAFLRILLAADEEARRAATEKRDPHPFFLLLDEMNLARVEHYFSDFLSAMESAGDDSDPTAGTLHLHDELDLEEGEPDEDGRAVPRRLRIPPNVFFLGTVNVDESTYMFSPKVLDRAFTIEFNGVDLAGLGKPIEDAGELELARWLGALRPPRRPNRDDWRWLMDYRDGVLGHELSALHDLLAKANRHFGYRVACEIACFVRLAVDQVAAEESAASAAARAALDLAILQKVLVKLAGAQADLTRVLDDLLWFTIAGEAVPEGNRDLCKWSLDAVEGEIVPADEASDRAPLFPRSAAKLWRMRQRLLERGFTSWIE